MIRVACSVFNSVLQILQFFIGIYNALYFCFNNIIIFNWRQIANYHAC